MFRIFKAPPPDSPLSPLAWNIVLYIYGAFAILCLVLIGLHIASHRYAVSFFLIFSMLAGLIVLDYLWTGFEHNYGGKRSYKKSPVGFWLGVLAILFFGVIMLFYIGGGWFVHIKSQ